MIARVDGTRMAEESAFLLAQSDPLRAAKIMFRALKNQSSGGRAAVVRWLVEELVRADPAGLSGTVADLARIARSIRGEN